MTRSAILPTLIVVAAVAFATGLFSSLALTPSTASAQAAPGQSSQSLPPIFQPGNTVTFGSQGPNLTIVQIHGDWIFVDQNRLGGFPGATEPEANDSRFWLYVPRIQDSWRLVQQGQ